MWVCIYPVKHMLPYWQCNSTRPYTHYRKLDYSTGRTLAVANSFAQPVHLTTHYRASVGLLPRLGWTTGLRCCRTTKNVAKGQRSFESALALTLEELDVGFSLKVVQKRHSGHWFQRTVHYLLLFPFIGCSFILLRQFERQPLIPPLGLSLVYLLWPVCTFWFYNLACQTKVNLQWDKVVICLSSLGCQL